ncbi:unnamed protein product [Protopolystoma xenopodis]|uniref:non-specific serine/threonine protein kinase n=1 Tax=Protopolystoma xenopodis TaxID=117903 RepID=A0A448XJG9_9PLAT|nr:unnamed protein product [Protopolystoma xenopodis]
MDISVAVKLCSPWNPLAVGRTILDTCLPISSDISESTGQLKPANSSSRFGHSGQEQARQGGDGANLNDALVLYRQEKRRWELSPMEASCMAYQELRAELNVLLRLFPVSICWHHLLDAISPFLGSASCDTPNCGTKQVKPGFASNLLDFTYVRNSAKTTCVGLMKQECQSRQTSHELADTLVPLHHLVFCFGVLGPKPLAFFMPLAHWGTLTECLQAVRQATILERRDFDLTAPSVSSLTNANQAGTFEEPRCPCRRALSWHPIHPVTIGLIVNQVASALAYLHHLCIIHRDLKPDNLLVWQFPPPSPRLPLEADYSPMNRQVNQQQSLDTRFDPLKVHLVLTDYGVSRSRGGFDGCRGYVGTVGYIAPEILLSGGAETYTEKVDIYSLSMLMCEIIKLGPPYDAQANVQFNLGHKVISGFRPELSDSVSSLFTSLYLM